MKSHPFASFLRKFSTDVENKSKQLNQALWLLETTGSKDAADLKASLDTEFKFLFHDHSTYRNLIKWEQDRAIEDPLLKRQLNVLIRAFKQNQIAEELVQEISIKEALLAQSYANFRPIVDGKSLSENEIREILKNENDPAIRKKVWEASKQIGEFLAPQILALVDLRNQAARSLGYSDYFAMQLELQEVDRSYLLDMLEEVGNRSNDAHVRLMQHINEVLQKRFPNEKLGPWAWSDPFGQEDPLDERDLDQLVKGIDIPTVCKNYYEHLGYDVQTILANSDMFERDGKNQHAFCIHIDRRGDVRTLNNVKPSIKWLDTVLHELGHGIYELGFSQDLPWLLREPPHMIPTEAMALLCGRQAYYPDSLSRLIGEKRSEFLKKARESLSRRQLIFSRWVLVMTAFESELYCNPHQDLNQLWWQLVEKYQKISAPNRLGKADWAAKFHIGLAPVYYYSYLLGEMFASSIQESLIRECGKEGFNSPDGGRFLQKKLFAPGNRMPWNELIQHVTGQPLSANAWLKEFA